VIRVEDWAEIRRLHRAEQMPIRAIKPVEHPARSTRRTRADPRLLHSRVRRWHLSHLMPARHTSRADPSTHHCPRRACIAAAKPTRRRIADPISLEF
jgi:hypothetical protein